MTSALSPVPHSAKTRGKDRSRKNSRDSQASSSSSRRCSPSPSLASAVTRTRSLKDLRHKGDILQTLHSFPECGFEDLK